jgi:hypothetical protein
MRWVLTNEPELADAGFQDVLWQVGHPCRFGHVPAGLVEHLANPFVVTCGRFMLLIGVSRLSPGNPGAITPLAILN